MLAYVTLVKSVKIQAASLHNAPPDTQTITQKLRDQMLEQTHSSSSDCTVLTPQTSATQGLQIEMEAP